jgi:DNA-binding HxlR family transcriptional regulator
MLVAHGMLTRADDPSHKQKVTYSLTEQAIELVPVLNQLSTRVVNRHRTGPRCANNCRRPTRSPRRKGPRDARGGA